MKQLLTFIAILCSYILCGAQATSLVVDNKVAGTLSQRILYDDKLTVQNLTITGEVNREDLEFVQELNRNYSLNGLLDVSEVKLAEKYSLTSVFRTSNRLSKLVLPKSATFWGNSAVFSSSQGISHLNVDSIIIMEPKYTEIGGLGNPSYLYIGEGVETFYVNNSEGGRKYTGSIEFNLPSSLKSLYMTSKNVGSIDYIKITAGMKTQVKGYSNDNNELSFFSKGTIYIPEGTKEVYENSMFKNLEIIEDIKLKGIGFENSEVIGYVGESYQILPTFYPSNALNKNLNWDSSSPEIAAIDENGYISANKYGSTEITAISEDGDFSDNFKFYVYNHVTAVTIPTELSVNISETKPIEVDVYPLGTSDNRIIWESSNNNIATIYENGQLKGISKGTCTISAKSVDGGLSAECVVTVIQPVESVVISSKTLQLKAGESSALTCSVLPANANNKSLIWESSNISIATVDDNGKVTALKGGEAKITVASAENPTIKDECVVTVIQPVTGISLNKLSMELIEDESEQLIATITPETASDKTVNWTSSDVSVAMVSPDGTVYAIKPGQATIMATTVDGGFIALCKVTVKAKTVVAESIALSSTKSDMTVGETLQLTATVLPNNTTDKNLRWTSTNTEIASVSESGLVSALKEGNAQIIASTTDGSNLSAVCEIAVNKRFVPISQIAIIPSSVKLAVDETLNMEVQITPADATNKNISWSTTDASVVSVSPEGMLNAKGIGTAMIIASTQDGTNLSVTCNVEVSEQKVLITSITIDPSAITGKVGEEYHLNALITPENASEKTVVWSSDNETVASIDGDGFVTLNAKGNALIKATATDGSDVYATCAVVVSDYSGINGIEIEPDAYVKVYNVQGALLFEGEYSACNLEAGTYIILSQGNCIKRIVK